MLECQAVASGRFREDLLARIHLWTFELPALKQRREDIAPNLDFELERFSRANGKQVSFNKEARHAFLKFAEAAEATGKKTLDPFSHVRDDYGFHIFDHVHLELPYPISKFLIILLLSAVIVAVVMLWLANKVKSGEPPKGRTS